MSENRFWLGFWAIVAAVILGGSVIALFEPGHAERCRSACPNGMQSWTEARGGVPERCECRP